MATSLTNITNPTLFTGTPALPTGFHYILSSSGVYVYGQNNTIYKIGIVRESDGTTIWGNDFYPYDGYPSAAQMVLTEATNAYNLWNPFYQSDLLAQEALALIGF